jgi:hypothetical protein
VGISPSESAKVQPRKARTREARGSRLILYIYIASKGEDERSKKGKQETRGSKQECAEDEKLNREGRKSAAKERSERGAKERALAAHASTILGNKATVSRLPGYVFNITLCVFNIPSQCYLALLRACAGQC